MEKLCYFQVNELRFEREREKGRNGEKEREGKKNEEREKERKKNVL